MQTRDQRYAADALKKVNELDKSEYKKYGTMAHKLPILVRTAGLTQALSFVEARGSTEQHKLLDHLAQTIQVGDRNKLLKEARENDLSKYMELTQKVMAALLWYKRYAQSVLGVDPSEDMEETHGE